MSLYQRKILRTGADLGQPGPLPEDVAAAALTAEQLARAGDHLPAWRGQGFVPAAEPEPAPADRWIHKVDFLLRLETGERLAIRAAAAGDAVIADLLDLVLERSDEVNLDSPAILGGLMYLEAEGLLAEGRLEEILE